MEKVQKLSHLEHVLVRPDSYVGPVVPTQEPYWLLQGDVFEKKDVHYPPALLKIFDEILVNAIDRNSLHPKEVTTISVTVDTKTGTISVENNGPLGGIAVELNEKEKVWNPELVFGHLLTSTNYDDTKERLVGGRNGYGAKLTNIYSSVFEIYIKDGINKVSYSQKWQDNMTKCFPPITKKYANAGSSVSIEFVPDWKRFNMKGMDDTLFKIFQKRTYDATICTSPNCKIKFNGELLPKISFQEYAKMYTRGEVYAVNIPRWSVCVGPSDAGFEQISFVNGICTTRGGTHVDHVTNSITGGIIQELAKKMQLRPQQVKQSLSIFVKATLVNPTFSSQIKSECTLKASDFGSKFELPASFIKNVLKTGILDELTALSKVKDLKELKKTDGSRRSKITGIPKLDDANKAGTSDSGKCTLIVTEGDSAKTLAVAGLSVVGRDLYGVFPLRGKCKNVRDASVNQLTTNQEFNDLKKILGLQQDKKYTSTSELRYGRLMIMTDADNDGSHIKGLILNMIHYFWPSLLDLRFVVSMVTPIIKATKGSEVVPFYTDASFRSWYGTGKSGWRIKYYKGLGTSTSLEARDYFKNIQNLTVAFEADSLTKESIVLAFDKTKADDRKTWLLENTEHAPAEIPYGDIKNLDISRFIHHDLVHFSLADLRRSIAHVSDGLKPSQRKVLHACFVKNLKDEMKVAQLAAYVSEKTCYHHGEVSLADTIVKLAHTFVGSNNMHLLEPCGQFGTRLMGGKDASQTRYIFTKLTKEARRLFDPRDDDVLTYLEDDGKSIEPDYFVPVIPSVLVNGTEGIGTGFSSYVPPFNPEDIIANIERILQNKPCVPMAPWFRGFKGTVFQLEGAWVAEGVWSTVGQDIIVKELPPGRWTQDYKEYLDELVEKKTIQHYINNSTTEDVSFVIQGYEGTNIIKDFKLRKTFHVTNMHLFHPEKGIHKYDAPEEILVDFMEIRMHTYKKRKKHLIASLEKKETMTRNAALFVDMVIHDRLRVFKRKRADLEAEMATHFPKMDHSFQYLLNITTAQYTDEAVEALKQEAARTTQELDLLKNTSCLDMWKTDLKNIT